MEKQAGESARLIPWGIALFFNAVQIQSCLAAILRKKQLHQVLRHHGDKDNLSLV